MSELARFYGIVIAIFFRDFGQHNEPHIHAGYAEHAASLRIADGAVIDGELPRPALRLVREWMRKHRAALNDAWMKAKSGQPVGRIGKKNQTRNRRGRKRRY